MALGIPSYPNPYSSTPMENAYGWLSFISIDLFHGTGRVVFNINPDSGDWDKPPVDQVSISLGQMLKPQSVVDPQAEPHQTPLPAVYFPTLAEVMGDPEFAAAYNTIGTKLYQHAASTAPVFQGATQV